MRWPAGLQFPSRHIGKDRTDDVAAPVSDTPKPEHPSVVCVEPRSARTEIRWRVAECRNRNSRRQLAVGSIQFHGPVYRREWHLGKFRRRPAAGLSLAISARLKYGIQHLPAHVFRVCTGRLEGK